MKPATYYVSPAFYKIQKPLDLFTTMHNFCAQEAKIFLSMSCAVQDGGKHVLDDGRVISNDFRVKFGTRIIYVEITTGGQAAMRKVIQKIAESHRNYETVLLAGLEEPPRHRQSGVCIKSNRQEALEIANELGINLRIFKLTNLDELEMFCKTGRVPYSHPKGR